MNIFEQELRRLSRICDGIANPVFAGRACYADLGKDNRVKLQFVTQGYADHYSALEATILNRQDGKVDALRFRFSDIWGKKYDHGYNGGIPHIWTDRGKSDWYVYRPTDADMKQLAAEVSGYLSVFTVRDKTLEKAPPESLVGKLREAANEPKPRGAQKKQDKQGPEL